MREYDDIPKHSLQEALSCSEETQRQRLERSKKHHKDRIADIDRALALLDKNPDIEELHDLLKRV